MFGRATIMLGIGPHSSSFLLSTPNLSGHMQSVCLPYCYTWCSLSANLEYRSEMCCTRSLEIQDAKTTEKSHHLHTIAQLCPTESSQMRHVSTIGNKLLNSNTSFICPHSMANFSLLAAEIGSGVLGIPANFNEFRVLASLMERRRSPEANQTLHNVWPSPG